MVKAYILENREQENFVKLLLVLWYTVRMETFQCNDDKEERRSFSSSSRKHVLIQAYKSTIIYTAPFNDMQLYSKDVENVYGRNC